MLGASGGEQPRDAVVPWLTAFSASPVPVAQSAAGGSAGAGAAVVASVDPGVPEEPSGADGTDQGADGTDRVVARHPSRPVVPVWISGGLAAGGRVAGSPLASLDPQRSPRARISAPLIGAITSALVGALAGSVLMALSDSFFAIALGIVAIGLVGAIASGLVAWRRLRNEIYQPSVELREAVLRLGAGEPPDHIGGPADGPLVSVARALESAGENVSATTERLADQARWGESSRQILDALDFARNESEVYRVVSEALELIDDRHPSELLMTPSGSSHELVEVAVNTATGSPRCPVTDTDDCLAIRRGQVVITDSSETINACPLLRGRPDGPCSAVCLPVAVSGRSVGVIHTTGPDRHPPGPEIVQRLSDLSRQVGARLGALRALESSRVEASTDGLTGLPNRRALESELQSMLEVGRGFVAVLADLDKFKSLNDTFGHEAGDRALQLFAKVMSDNVRGQDLVARVGGEEFVIAYPGMTVQGSIEAIERLRTGLASAVAVAAVHPFTCSFGVTHSSVGGTVSEILRVADAGLLRAKELGGDQVVYSDQALAAEVFERHTDRDGNGERGRNGKRNGAPGRDG